MRAAYKLWGLPWGLFTYMTSVILVMSLLFWLPTRTTAGKPLASESQVAPDLWEGTESGPCEGLSFQSFGRMTSPQNGGEFNEVGWVDAPDAASRFNYFVSIRGAGHTHECSGIVINGSWVLTSAHCIDLVGPNPLVVFLNPSGTCTTGVAPDALTVRVEDAQVHPGWTGRVEDGWDAALLRLHQFVNISGPTLAAPTYRVYGSMHIFVLGMGDHLQMAEMTVVNNHKCPGLKDLKQDMLCAVSDNAQLQPGHSGGPALILHTPSGPNSLHHIWMGRPETDLLVGVVSHTNLSQGCRRGAVFARVMDITLWIASIVNKREKHRRAANEMLAVGRVPKTPHHYVSRQALEQPAIDRLLKGLRDGSHRRVSIEGMPGFGKTALAVAIIRGGNLAHHFEDGVLWWNVRLHGSSAGKPVLHLFQDMHRHLLELFKRPAMSNGGSGCEARNEKDFLMAINKLLRGKKFLLVLDSLRDKVVLREVLEMDCALIVTSQTRHALGEDDSVHRLQVGPLAEDEAYDLLCNVAGRGATHRAAAQILKVSEGHPLALSIMGKALGEAFEMEQEDARREEIKELLELMGNVADRMGLVMEDLDLLNVEAQGRHKMLYRCFDFALDGLSEDERRCLISLVVLPRGQSARVCDLQRLWGVACPGKMESRIRVLEERYLLHRWGDGTLGLKGLTHDYLVAISSTQPRYISMANGARNRFWGVGS